MLLENLKDLLKDIKANMTLEGIKKRYETLDSSKIVNKTMYL